MSGLPFRMFDNFQPSVFQRGYIFTQPTNRPCLTMQYLLTYMMHFHTISVSGSPFILLGQESGEQTCIGLVHC